ncbi:glycylpeptide N-tetradecanoyltransferase 1b [Electrophorus electricus]|uniref:Glycylpeptide N-tetradecanoyltransferase n=1 Tax=Electrophorus electricus TaxID=8005 RepID=A0A4W4G1K3_ELEEL|nr:glycylpeptide N-tetradecanoyltransferase 1b [Electrophorus electricus]
MPENAHMAGPKSSAKKSEGDRGEKKAKKPKKTKGQTWAKEGPRDPFEMLDSLPEEKQQEIQKALYLFSLGQGPPKTMQDARRHNYRFWNTQPVRKIDEEVTSHGPIQSEMQSIREESYSLPQGFCWESLDLGNPEQLGELCTLLNENYTEEDDNTLRFHYTPQFLLWALCPPGWRSEWHCGVRVSANRKLVGFISAVPTTVQIHSTERKMVEVNFLCVHKKLRSKRMAPVLIREMAWRVQRHGLMQAIYGTSAMLPTPMASSRYWHRSLNPRKLIELNFSSLSRNMTLQRALKLNRLPEKTKTAGLRLMARADIPRVQVLLRKYLRGFHLFPILNQEEVQHWLLPQDGVIDTYVVEAPDGVITDMVSFYTMSSTVLNHLVHTSLKAAYALYTVATATPVQQLMEDVLVIAKARGFDVFMALSVMENNVFLEPLRFTEGGSGVQYYLYNWRCPSITEDKVGMVLK